MANLLVQEDEDSESTQIAVTNVFLVSDKTLVPAVMLVVPTPNVPTAADVPYANAVAATLVAHTADQAAVPTLVFRASAELVPSVKMWAADLFASVCPATKATHTQAVSKASVTRTLTAGPNVLAKTTSVLIRARYRVARAPTAPCKTMWLSADAHVAPPVTHSAVVDDLLGRRFARHAVATPIARWVKTTDLFVRASLLTLVILWLSAGMSVTLTANVALLRPVIEENTGEHYHCGYLSPNSS